MTTPTRTTNHPTHQIILDTDIGSDVDDAMALAVILGSPQLDLAAVTTVYGDTRLRAQLASRYARLAGRSIRAVPGATVTRSGRAVWWPGHEGSLHTGLDAEPIDTSDAVAVMADLIDSSDEPVDLVAIGPLTNIAELFTRRPDIPDRLGQLWVMGGAFDGRAGGEHNFRSDATAAAIVFGTSAAITVVGLEVTEQLKITEDAIGHLASAGPLGRALLDDIAQWRTIWGSAWNVPHDPLTVLAITDPELFDYSNTGRVTITVDEDQPDVGESSFVPGTGRTRLITGMDTPEVARLMIDRIEGASVRVAG